MSAAGHAALEQALALSDSMLAAAREDRWDAVVELDGRRQPLLHAGHPRDPRSGSLLRQLLERNTELLALAGRAREAAAAALGRHSHAHRALRAYVGLAG
ncbi:flagellar protein FliT [Fulvimonas soli]|jgi:hypothetical protein|uniref:Flagellar protein FliT n=1 Tax=Fulvimonas soli TaxID=155197 RepID=A0A316HXT5_9GAMM|nr:flagellar protein FliT [Fulvimonas soli]PWK83084.1 protein FliT [Fulvimonas soli]TNY26128.1 hypothetical protein BV497_10310 [Fulvimonas soli]